MEVSENGNSEEDAYMTQLQNMFNELAVEGHINQENLLVLCDNLSLDDHQKVLIKALLFGEKPTTFSAISFQHFENAFLALLSEISDFETESLLDPKTTLLNNENSSLEKENELTEKDINEINNNQDVPPKLIHNGKSYGRRSLPLISNDKTNNEEKEEDVKSSTADCDLLVAENCEEVFERDFYELTSSMNHDGGRLSLSMLNVSTGLQMDIKDENIHVFGSIDKDSSGYILTKDLVSMWLEDGIESPKELIQSLGFDPEEKWLDADLVTESLERSISTTSKTMYSSMSMAIMTSYKRHITYLKSQHDQVSQQLSKVREDLGHSEARNTSLISEAEERYSSSDRAQERMIATIEKQWTKKLRAAKANFDHDREAIFNQLNMEKAALTTRIDDLESREKSLLRAADRGKYEISACEQETRDLAEKLTLSEKKANRLQRDLECLLDEKVDGSDSMNSSQEEKFAMIIKEYETQCRELSDRNDELLSEIESLHKEAKRCINNEMSHADVAFCIGEDGDNIRNMSMKQLHSSDSAAIDIRFAKMNVPSSDNTKMEALEASLRELQEEKRRIESKVKEEKKLLENQIEKLKSENCLLLNTDKNKTNQALSNAIKQKDEFERLLQQESDLRDTERTTHEKTISNVCQEFQQEKKMLTSRHQIQIDSLEKELQTTKEALSLEQAEHTRLVEQLEQEKERHMAAIEAQHHIVNNIESSQSVKAAEMQESFEIRQMEWKEAEQKLRAEHVQQLHEIRTQLQRKLDQVLVDRDQIEMDKLSICDEFERTKGNFDEERESLNHRIKELKESFEREIVEVKELMEHEKENLKQQFLDESARLEKEVRLHEEQKMQNKLQKMRKKEEHYEMLDQLNTTLQTSNCGYKSELEESRNEMDKIKVEIKKRESEIKVRSESLNADQTSVQFEIENLQKQIEMKNETEKQLNDRITLLHKELLKHDQLKRDVQSVEVKSLLCEKEDLAKKVFEIEEKYSQQQMENARLVAKNYHLEKSDNDVAMLHDLQQRNDKRKRPCKIALQETEDLRTELNIKKKMHEELQRKIENLNSPEDSALQARLKKTREQLYTQMKKTKEMYKVVAKNENLLKTLYCENTDLMKALQITEGRQRDAERRATIESDKNTALMLLLRRVCPEDL